MSDSDYRTAYQQGMIEWRSNVRDHLLPNYRQVAHLADVITGLVDELIEANTLFNGHMADRSHAILLEIADELNEKLNSLDGLPSARDMGHEVTAVLMQMRIACGRFGLGKSTKTISANELAALKIARERFQEIVRDLEETAAYEGNFDEPRIMPMVCTNAVKGRAEERKRPAYDRDHKFLEWYDAEGTTTYHSHAGIVEKWNLMNKEQREAVCRGRTSTVTRDVVIKAVTKAQGERDNK